MIDGIVKPILMFALMFALIIGPPCWLIYYYLIGGRGKVTRRNFQQMGDVRGQTFEQIEAQAGKPRSETNLAEGVRIIVWGHTGYYITLRFRNNVCEGVTSEVNA